MRREDGSCGFELVQRRQVADDREDGAAAAGRIGRRERCQRGVGQHDRVTQGQRPVPHRLHQQQRQPLAQPGLLIPEREHERPEDQPHRAVREARQFPVQSGVGAVEARFGQLLRAEQDPGRQHRDDGNADEADGAAGQRFQHQADDDAGEDGEEIPGVLRQAGGRESGRWRWPPQSGPMLSTPVVAWRASAGVRAMFAPQRR